MHESALEDQESSAKLYPSSPQIALVRQIDICSESQGTKNLKSKVELSEIPCKVVKLQTE